MEQVEKCLKLAQQLLETLQEECGSYEIGQCVNLIKEIKKLQK